MKQKYKPIPIHFDDGSYLEILKNGYNFFSPPIYHGNGSFHRNERFVTTKKEGNKTKREIEKIRKLKQLEVEVQRATAEIEQKTKEQKAIAKNMIKIIKDYP